MSDTVSYAYFVYFNMGKSILLQIELCAKHANSLFIRVNLYPKHRMGFCYCLQRLTIKIAHKILCTSRDGQGELEKSPNNRFSQLSHSKLKMYYMPIFITCSCSLVLVILGALSMYTPLSSRIASHQPNIIELFNGNQTRSNNNNRKKLTTA